MRRFAIEYTLIFFSEKNDEVKIFYSHSSSSNSIVCDNELNLVVERAEEWFVLALTLRSVISLVNHSHNVRLLSPSILLIGTFVRLFTWDSKSSDKVKEMLLSVNVLVAVQEDEKVAKERSWNHRRWSERRKINGFSTFRVAHPDVSISCKVFQSHVFRLTRPKQQHSSSPSLGSLHTGRYSRYLVAVQLNDFSYGRTSYVWNRWMFTFDCAYLKLSLSLRKHRIAWTGFFILPAPFLQTVYKLYQHKKCHTH